LKYYVEAQGKSRLYFYLQARLIVESFALRFLFKVF
jgi:hypothetical protein